MPTRSRPALSRASLACFLAQTYEPRELVIYDDEDDPSFADPPADPGIRYFRGPRLLLGAKRNALCAMARGGIIAHWDSDDWSSPDRLLSQHTTLLLAPTMQMTGYHSLLFWDERTALGYEWTGNLGYSCGASLFYRKSFWQANPFPEVAVAEDNAMVVAAQRSGGVASERGGRMLIARVHGKNTSNAQRVGQNNWPMAPRAAFPEEFFEAIR